ncbi:S1 family peptidase [Paenibacillus mendelii]|nr:S1 family peptidase [Paenibacillus mendelii]
MSRRMSAPAKRVRAAFFRSRIRPVPGGTSIGRFRGTGGSTGTCGLIVIRNNQLYMLSNNHVIIQDNQFSATILQPGPADGGQLNNDVVGRSVQFVPFNLTGPNFMDAAIAQPLSNSLLNPRYLVSTTGQLITPRGNLNSYAVGNRFYKSGRTTGLVFGTVESIGMQVNVGPYPELGGAFLQFRNQTVLAGPNNISLPGDSGSVWMSGGFAAALNFAGSGTRSISTPIASVLSTFGLRVAAPAGAGVFKAGAVKGAAPKGNFAYVQPLSSVQRKQVRVIRAVSPK